MFYRVLIRGKPKAELGPLLFHFLQRLFQRELLTGGSADFLQPADRERFTVHHNQSHTEQHGFTNQRSALLVWILGQSELHHLEERGVLVRLDIKSHCITDLISDKNTKLHSSKQVNAALMVTIKRLHNTWRTLINQWITFKPVHMPELFRRIDSLKWFKMSL